MRKQSDNAALCPRSRSNCLETRDLKTYCSVNGGEITRTLRLHKNLEFLFTLFFDALAPW